MLGSACQSEDVTLVGDAMGRGLCSTGRFLDGRFSSGGRCPRGASDGRFRVAAAAACTKALGGAAIGEFAFAKGDISILRLRGRERTTAAQASARKASPPVTPPIIAGILQGGSVPRSFFLDVRAYG